MVIGLQRLLESKELFRDRKIGLVTNRSGVTPDLRRNIDAILEAGLDLRVIFSPEHGLYAAAGDGEPVSETSDPLTGLPVISTYPKIDEAIERVKDFADTVLFDIQDVGVRFYTYISTLRKFIEGAVERDFEVVVLDRPNPITGRIEGWLPEREYRSFVCAADVPVRHGLTIGEIARIYAAELEAHELVQVVTMLGYDKTMWFEETGLFWVPPSPNIPTVETALVYAGAGFIEGTNLSEGRGTTRPFHLIGAPWIDAFSLTESMNAFRFPGVRFLPAFFRPTISKHAGELCQGVEVFVTDRSLFRPIEVVLWLIQTVRDAYPEDFRWTENRDGFWIDRLAGTSRLREAIETGSLVDFLNENMVSTQYLDQLEPLLLYHNSGG